ncbi:MAG TPA: RNA polymerase sigma factor [Terriglobales bacterium]|nr:RNA polymerase sigma factor [Terriglobales bacterium]
MPKSLPLADDAERYRRPVTRYIRYLIRSGSDAEDLAQEVFLRAHRGSDTLRDPAALESWLYQIATHVSIDLMRQRARTLQHQAETPVEELPVAEQRRLSPLTVVRQNEMSTCVQRYVATLRDGYKAVLLLHDSDGLTADEIAHLLELPLSTVKMRLHRARRQLQAALKSACEFGHDERGVFVCEPKRDEPD